MRWILCLLTGAAVAALLLAGCAPAPQPAPLSTLDEIYSRLVTAAPDASATPTPFRPLAVTPTRTATATASGTPQPSPTATASASPLPSATSTRKPTSTLPSWVTTPQASDGVKNILLLGSDYRPGGGFRTDVILLVSVNTEKQSVGVVSFPRDLFVNIPGYGMNRINSAFTYGGFDLLAATFETNFGVRPERYVLTSFDGFVAMIDDMQGIEVEAAAALRDHCDLRQQDAQGFCSVETGKVWMDGPTALWYVRSRYSSSDIDRTRRQQEVLDALFKRLSTRQGLASLPKLYGRYRQSVETNLALEDVLQLAWLAPTVKRSNSLSHYLIGPGLVWDYIVPGSGAMVLIPNLPGVQDLVRQAQNLP